MDLIGKEILKKGEAMEKSIHEQQKAEFMYLWVREKKNFETAVIILRYIRNVYLSYLKAILTLHFLPKYPFFYFRDCPKNEEGNKQRRRRKYMRKSN